MASDKGPVATEAPFIAPSAPPAAADSSLAAGDIFAPEAARAGSLKRPREAASSPPATALSVDADLSPVTKIQRLGYLASRASPVPLTGAAAEEEERRRRAEEERRSADASENPGHRVLAALMSATNMVMSRAQDAPDAAPASAAVPASDADSSNSGNLVKPEPPVAIPPANAAPAAEHGDGTSPQSASSAQTPGAAYQVVHSPAPMDVDHRNEHGGSFVAQSETPTEEKNTAYSYPGIAAPTASMAAPALPQRGMSLPMTSSASAQHPELAPRSPSSKKHKCPYCETEFTRHHNLKSHLLTHSQEKPYVCQTCQMRFRRLHDLKRHSKLHTGEKPHICNKCNRKFARGDALARHAKGAGGCAVRRASEGSFGGEEYDESMHDGDDTAMTGVLYDGNEADMTEEDRRRLSLPAMKAQHAAAPEGFSHSHARTFPQAGPRQGVAGVVTSPKPLSPGSSALAAQLSHEHAASLNRQRSPSATTQMAQQMYRRQSDLASPRATAAAASAAAASGGSTINHHQPGARGSGDNSANLFATGDNGIWTYIHSTDTKWQATTKQLQDHIAGLQAAKEASEARIDFLQGRVDQLAEEVVFLRQQVPRSAAPSSSALRNDVAASIPRRVPDAAEAAVHEDSPRHASTTSVEAAAAAATAAIAASGQD